MKFKKYNELTPKKKKKAMIYNIIIGVLCAVIVFCGINIGSYYYQEWSNEHANDEIIDEVVDMGEDNASEDGSSSENSSSTSKGYYHAPIPQSINFDKLLAKNDDVVGWIFNENGIINYPIVKGDDNEYYLNHNINKAKNVNGCIFMDSANNKYFYHSNTFVYGHSMKNGTMFASLLRYRNQSYYDAYPVFYLYAPHGKYKLEVFSAYETDANDKVYTFDYNTKDNSELISHAFSKSRIKADVKVAKEDRIVTLSTCAYSSKDARFLVICKLTVIEEQDTGLFSNIIV